jgi:hypothetical protein
MIGENESQMVGKKTILAISDISAYVYRDMWQSTSR